ncbi:hypothetical protein O9993_15400 [Vibrio lentus]|nr:hypothetical protein [Vibrio lentus]
MTTVQTSLYKHAKFSPIGQQGALMAQVNPKLAGAVKATISELVEEVVKPDYLLMKRVEQAFHILNQLQINETPKLPYTMG